MASHTETLKSPTTPHSIAALPLTVCGYRSNAVVHSTAVNDYYLLVNNLYTIEEEDCVAVPMITLTPHLNHQLVHIST